MKVRQGRQGRKVDKEEENLTAQEVLTAKDDSGNKPLSEIPLPQSKSAIIVNSPCRKQEIVRLAFGRTDNFPCGYLKISN